MSIDQTLAHPALAALLSVSHGLSGAFEREQVLEIASRGLSDAFADALSAVWIWDDSLKALQLQGVYAASEALVASANAMARLETGRQQSPTYRAYERGEPVVETHVDPVALLHMPWTREGMAPLTCCYAIPLKSADARHGVLTVLRSEPYPDGELAVRLLSAIGAQVATALSQLRRQDELSERTKRLRIANDQLERVVVGLKEMDRIKTEFLNSVSHELRTPLSIIQGYAELLVDGALGALNAEQVGVVGHVCDSAIHLSALVDDLLDYAAMNAGKFRIEPRVLEYQAVVSAAIKPFKVMCAKKNQELALEIPAEHLLVKLDPLRITQVLHNLVSNAVKYTPEAGRIVLRVCHGKDHVRTQVIDTGIGIPEHQRSSLFTSFHRLDNSLTRRTGGTGLGLALAKGLVEAHEGQIGFESTFGSGSTFWFDLPLAGDYD